MNRRTVKRVKDPKSCGPCEHWVAEKFVSHPTPLYRCRVKPIMAQKENSCEQFQPPPIDKEATDLADADHENMINNVVGPLICRAYHYLEDCKNLNDRLSTDSAVRLLYSALSDLKTIAGLIDINVEG